MRNTYKGVTLGCDIPESIGLDQHHLLNLGKTVERTQKLEHLDFIRRAEIKNLFLPNGNVHGFQF